MPDALTMVNLRKELDGMKNLLMTEAKMFLVDHGAALLDLSSTQLNGFKNCVLGMSTLADISNYITNAMAKDKKQADWAKKNIGTKVLNELESFKSGDKGAGVIRGKLGNPADISVDEIHIRLVKIFVEYLVTESLFSISKRG